MKPIEQRREDIKNFIIEQLFTKNNKTLTEFDIKNKIPCYRLNIEIVVIMINDSEEYPEIILSYDNNMKIVLKLSVVP